MPHAALWVVQREDPYVEIESFLFQCRTRLCGWCSNEQQEFGFPLLHVSMPHAALWVVQLIINWVKGLLGRFQCRTRLCGWCSRKGFLPWL